MATVELDHEFSDEETEDIDTSQVMLILAPLVSKSLGKLVMILTMRHLFLRLKATISE
jgi:hypothetical protein